jgi:DNA processing protein
MNKIFQILKLYRSPNIGAVNFYYLLEKFSTLDNIFKNLENLESKWGKKITLAEDFIIENEIKLTLEKNIEFIAYDDVYYPNNIKKSYDISPIFSSIGNKNLLNTRLISVVGTRDPSANGLKFCTNLCKKLGESGFTIVSGMAKGIDKSAHMSSLYTGTIAVVAGGVDVIYPYENTDCYNLLKTHGLIISDQPVGTQPSGHLFPRRNSIIAALGESTCVIESTEGSGALITAKRASKYKKTIFAVPGHPYDTRYYGNNYLLKNEGILLTEIGDILNREVAAYELTDEINYRDFSDNDSDKIRNLLSITSISINELSYIANIHINKVLSIITEMSILGLVEITPDNKICLSVGE